MFGYELGVVSASVGLGFFTRQQVAKAIDTIPETATKGGKLALSLAVGVGIAMESGDPALAIVTGAASTGVMWFVLNQISGYVKPVVSNGLGMAVTLSGFYAGLGLFSDNSTTGEAYDTHHHGPATGSTLPVESHHHGHSF